ncbi:MAG: HAD-IIIA family hydrolase [bacterium]
MTAPKTRFTVFLDRDGVLDKDRWPGLLTPRQWNWLPGAREALARLNRPDVQVCLATNQPWAHTGILTTRRLAAIHARMLDEARAAGGRIDRIEAATWPWGRRRKPRPGMLEDGAAAFGGIDKARAIMVGDKPRDVEAARRFGIAAIRVGPHGDVPDLAAAVERILGLLG